MEELAEYGLLIPFFLDPHFILSITNLFYWKGWQTHFIKKFSRLASWQNMSATQKWPLWKKKMVLMIGVALVPVKNTNCCHIMFYISTNLYFFQNGRSKIPQIYASRWPFFYRVGFSQLNVFRRLLSRTLNYSLHSLGETLLLIPLF